MGEHEPHTVVKSNPVGRPTVMTPEVISKLEQAFAIGATDKEATFYAGVSMAALYDYQKLKPEFVERKEALKETLVLKARQTLAKSMDDPNNAKWYLERKKKVEFAPRQETTGADGEALTVQVVAYKPQLKAAIRADHLEAHLKDHVDNTDTPQLPTTPISAGVPSGGSEVQDSSAPSPGGQEHDGAQRADQEDAAS